MNEQDRALREIRSVWGQAEAEVIKSLLESHGITCLFRGHILQSIYPVTVDGLGEIKIFVTENDYDSALAVLAELPKPEDVEDFEKDGEEGA